MKTAKTKLISIFMATLMLLTVCSAMFSVSATATKGYIELTIDFLSESVDINWKDDDKGALPLDAIGIVDYMYTLKPNDSNQASEKYYPIIGSYIDISKYISAKGEVTIAVKEASDPLNSTGKYATRKTIKIPTRPTIAKDAVVYNVAKEQFENGHSAGVDVILGDSGFEQLSKKGAKAEDAAKTPLDIWAIPMDAFPAGATFAYRVSAVEQTYDGTTGKVKQKGSFASLEGKGKIGAQPKEPKLSLAELKADTKKGIDAGWTVKGATEKVAIYLGYIEEDGKDNVPVWVTLSSDLKNPSVGVLKSFIKTKIAETTKKLKQGQTFTEAYVKPVDDEGKPVAIDPDNATSRDNVAEYLLTFRTPASDKKPASAKAALALKKDQYEIVPTATFTGTDISVPKAAADVAGKKFTITLKNGTFAAGIAAGDITIDLAKEVTAVTPKGTAGNVLEVTVTFAKDTGDETLSEITIKEGKILDDDGFATSAEVVATGNVKVSIIEKEAA